MSTPVTANPTTGTTGTGMLENLPSSLEVGGLSPEEMLFVLKSRMGDLDNQIRDAYTTMENRAVEVKALSDKIELLLGVQAAAQATNADGESVATDEKLYEELIGKAPGAASLKGILDDPKLQTALFDRVGGSPPNFEEIKNFHTVDGVDVARSHVVINGEEIEIKKYNDTLKLLKAGSENSEVGEWVDALRNIENPEGGALGRFGLTLEDVRVTATSLGSQIEKLKIEQQSINSSNELEMVGLQTLVQQRGQLVTMVTQMINKMFEAMNSITRNI